MTAEQAWCWKFSGPITDRSEIQCAECGEWSPLAEWDEGLVECELCGDHSAMQCTKCGDLVDHVNQYAPLDARSPEEAQ